MDLKHRAVRGVSWSAVELIGRQGIALAVFIVLARLLGPETFGLLALALVVIGLAEMWISEGMADVLVQRETIEDGHIDAAFWALMCVAGLLASLAALLAGPMAAIMGAPAVEPLMLALAPAIVLTALATVPSVLLRRNFEFRTLAIRSTGSVVAGGIVGLAMALSGHGVWALVAHQLVIRGFAAAVVWWRVPWRPQWRCRASHLRDLRHFSGNVMLLQLLAIGGQRSFAFFIGLYLDANAVGYYAMAVRCFDVLVTVVVTPITRVSFSVFSRLQADRERLSRAVTTVMQAVVLISAPAFAGAALVSPQLVPVVFGPEWAPAVPVLSLYMVYGFLLAPIMTANAMMRGIGKPQWIVWLSALTLAINIPGLVALTRYGVIWPVVTLIVAGIAACPVYMRLVHRTTGLTAGDALRIWGPTAAALSVMAGGVLLWQHLAAMWLDRTGILIGAVALGVLLYAGAQRLFNRRQTGALFAEFKRLRSAPQQGAGQ